MKTLKNLSDKELVTRLHQLVVKEKKTTLEILPHLIEVGRRGLYLQKGYGSLFDYCKGELGYSDASAWRRVKATESIRKFPEAYALLKCGRVNLCTLGKISKVITPELLGEICDKSQAEVDLILAAHNPKKAIRDQMRQVTVFRPVKAKAGQAQRTGARLKSAGALQPAMAPSRDSEPSLRSEVRRAEDFPHAFERVQVWDVRFAGDEELRELTEWMKSHLSNKYPEGVGLLEAYKYALRYVREREDPARRAERRKKRQSKQKTPKKSVTRPTRTRHIPVNEQDKVWVRDKGQCAFVGPGGKKCNATHHLQLDHYLVPYARGGSNIARNLRLLCGKHNRFTAQEVYGKRHMTKYPMQE
jgi:5-methylcytosine-specific restriction endonuclease McrA